MLSVRDAKSVEEGGKTRAARAAASGPYSFSGAARAHAHTVDVKDTVDATDVVDAPNANAPNAGGSGGDAQKHAYTRVHTDRDDTPRPSNHMPAEVQMEVGVRRRSDSDTGSHTLHYMLRPSPRSPPRSVHSAAHYTVQSVQSVQVLNTPKHDADVDAQAEADIRTARPPSSSSSSVSPGRMRAPEREGQSDVGEGARVRRQGVVARTLRRRGVRRGWRRRGARRGGKGGFDERSPGRCGCGSGGACWSLR